MTGLALIYAEGALDLVAAQKLMRSLGISLEGATLIDTHGRGGFWQRAPKYEEMARHNGPVFGLTDLDRDECAPRLLAAKLRHFPHARNALRIAVRALESWMLADRNAIAGFMRVSGRRIPPDPDALDDPKIELVNVARHSKRRSIRADMVPQQGKSGKVGAGYEPRMREFIVNAWEPRRAAINSPSLRKAIAAVQRVTT